MKTLLSILVILAATLSYGQPRTDFRKLFGLNGNVRKSVITSKSDATIFGQVSTFQSDVEIKEFSQTGELEKIERYVFNTRDSLELFQSERYSFSQGLIVSAETTSSSNKRVALYDFSKHDSEGRPTEVTVTYPDKTEHIYYRYDKRRVVKTTTTDGRPGKLESKSYYGKNGRLRKEIIQSFDDAGLSSYALRRFKYVSVDKSGNWTKRVIRVKMSKSKLTEERELFYF